MKHTAVFLLLIYFLLSQTVPAQALTAPVTSISIVNFNLNRSRPVARHLNGINQSWLAMPIDNEYSTIAIKNSRTSLIRFVGGMQDNFYSWSANAPDWDMAQRILSYHPGKAAVIERWVRQYNGLVKAVTPLGFAATAQKDTVDVVWDLNLYSNTVSQIAGGLQALKNAGVVVKYIELGNEMYYYVPLDSYVSKAMQVSQAIRRIYPDARIGVVGPPNLLPFNLPPTLWGRFADIPKGDWYDAVSVHFYAGSTGWLPTPQYVLEAVPAKLHETIMALKLKYPGKEAWFTEWGLLIPPTNTAVSTYYFQAVYNYTLLLEMLKYPEITLANLHTFIGNLGPGQSLLYAKNAIAHEYYAQGQNPPSGLSFQDIYAYSAGYWPFIWFGKAARSHARVAWVDTPEYLAVYFFNRASLDGGDVAVINKLDEAQDIGFSTLRPSYPYTVSLLAYDWLASGNENSQIHPTMSRLQYGSVSMPPYSIVYIHR